MTTESTRLKQLHDRLRSVLEDWDGRFHNEDKFEAVFEDAISEVEQTS